MTTSTVVRRRLDDARKADARLYNLRDSLIERLAKVDGRLKANRRAIARLDKRLKAKVEVELLATAAPPPLPADPVKPADDGFEIPALLDRRNLLPDPKTKDRKAERKAIEKEKLDAKLTGKTKRMPLTGRAALDSIRAAVFTVSPVSS